MVSLDFFLNFFCFLNWLSHKEPFEQNERENSYRRSNHPCCVFIIIVLKNYEFVWATFANNKKFFVGFLLAWEFSLSEFHFFSLEFKDQQEMAGVVINMRLFIMVYIFNIRHFNTTVSFKNNFFFLFLCEQTKTYATILNVFHNKPKLTTVRKQEMFWVLSRWTALKFATKNTDFVKGAAILSIVSSNRYQWFHSTAHPFISEAISLHESKIVNNKHFEWFFL